MKTALKTIRTLIALLCFVSTAAYGQPRDTRQPPPPPELRIGIGVISGGNLVLTWPSEPGGNYQVLATTNLSEPFAPVGGTIPSAGTHTSFTNVVTPIPAHYFRVQRVF